MKLNKVIRVFISSTFKDMDAERDAIKFKVVPMLNERYKVHGLEVQVVDLRIGVNTTGLSEESQENKVLEVCIDNIDSSRPFFIGLIGERYGWIPPNKRFEYIFAQLSKEHQPLISGMQDRSVTELEILYGAIGENGKYIDNALFFFRDIESYGTMPLDVYQQFVDLSKDKQNKLQNLKQRIKETTIQSPTAYPIDYHLEWDHQKKVFSDGIESFADMVFARLDGLIAASLGNKEFNLDWWERWRVNDETLVNSYSNRAFVNKTKIAKLESQILKGGRLICISSPGYGKSTVLALLRNSLRENKDILVLTAFVGSEAYSLSPNGILARWINEISAKMGKEIPFRTYESALENNLPKLVKQLSVLINECHLKTIILIDDFDSIKSNKDLSYLNCIPDGVPFFATSVTEDPYVLSIDSSLECYHHSGFSEEDMDMIIRNWEIRHSNDLGNEIRDLIRSLSSSPRILSLLLMLIQNFSSEDYKSIRSLQKKNEMDKITEYVYQTIKNAPGKLDELICYVTDSITRNFKNPMSILSMLRMISLSPTGLSDKEIESLGGEGFVMLDFKIAVYNIADFFYNDTNLHRLRFRSKVLANCFSNTCNDYYYHQLLKYTLSLPDDDTYKQDNCLYFSIKTRDVDIIKSHFLFDPEVAGSKYQASKFYYSSINYLLTHSSDFIKEIRSCGDEMDDTEKSIFYYYICYNGQIELSHRLQMICKLIDDIQSINPAKIKTASVLYELGWMLSDYALCVSHNSSMAITDVINAFEHALSAFSLCKAKKSDYGDVENMITAQSAQLIPLYAKTGDFAAMETIINNLSFNN